MTSSSAVVLVAHGTVDALDDLPEFLRNIRRGHDAPPELLAEVRRRYEAIGGQSPLNAINREVARKVETRLGVTTRLANRLFHPYPVEVLRELAGVRRVAVVPLAQHSAYVYAAAMREAAGPDVEIRAAENWGLDPGLVGAFADALAPKVTPDCAVVFTAHSLPMPVILGGDPYEGEVRASADAIATEARARGATFAEHVVCFQSQGMGKGPPWLGPDLRSTLTELAARRKRAVVAPIGFLADHVEILYDLDIEAQGWAKELGIELARTASLNASEGLVDAVASVAERVLGGG